MFRLPDQPARYKVSIAWPSGSSNALDDTIGVDATLKIDGVDEVGYGKTIEFKGSGFSEGVSVNLYARPGASSTNCKDAEVSSWSNIGSSSVGSNYRFVAEVEISTNVFRSAGKYQICALDGAGVSSGTSLAITVEAGIKVVGGGSNRNFRPGDQITVTIEGGGINAGISQVLIGGRPANWNRGGGNNLFVTIPSSAFGTITVAVIFTEGPTASANITIGAIGLVGTGNWGGRHRVGANRDCQRQQPTRRPSVQRSPWWCPSGVPGRRPGLTRTDACPWCVADGWSGLWWWRINAAKFPAT